MEFDKTVKLRSSVRSFKETKKPNYKDVIKAIDSATRAPLAGNLPCIKYILVSDKEKISELAQAAQQNFIAKVHYVVVICSDQKLLKEYYYDRAERYVRQQAGAAIENFLLKIVDLGLASCWVGAFSDETVKRILRIPDSVDVEAILPVGYEFENPAHKKAMIQGVETSLFFDKYKNKTMKEHRAPEYQ